MLTLPSLLCRVLTHEKPQRPVVLHMAMMVVVGFCHGMEARQPVLVSVRPLPMLEVPSLRGIKGKVRKATQPPEFLQILWLDAADVGVVNKDDAFDDFVCAFISGMSVELMGKEAGELAVICKGFFDWGGEVTLQEFVEGLELDSGRGVGMSEGEVVDALDFGELEDRSGKVVGGVGGQVHGGPLQGRLAG